MSEVYRCEGCGEESTEWILAPFAATPAREEFWNYHRIANHIRHDGVTKVHVETYYCGPVRKVRTEEPA